MKKFFALALAVLMVMSMFAGCNTKKADNDLNLVEDGKLIMSTNAAFPPYESTDDTGKFIGIDIEVAQAIADKLGLELVIDNMEFTAALEAAQKGKADMVMAGVTVTPDRELVMEFSNSYATGIQVVIVPEDSTITSIDDLEGKKIGTQMGTTGYLYCSDTPENGGYGEENVVAYDNGISAVMALKKGQIDCIVIDNAPAQAFVKENPGLKILETEFAVEDYAIGFAKGNTALKEAVNKALAELIADGTVQKIVDKYIPAEQK
jgi:polar amino acid transport system substrate-binding protein